MTKKQKIRFPDDFLWGVATSAYQIEGGIKNDWSEWEQSPQRLKYLKKQNLNPDDFICAQASDSYRRYKEDIDLIANLGCGAYRFSIEWARVEPRRDRFDIFAIRHYKKQIALLRKKNIEPFVTLWHWTNPAWIAELGGWENKEVIKHFLKYVEKIVKALGDDVKYWMTLNEPETFIGLSYISGRFPPQARNPLRANKVFKNLMTAHEEAYKLIHKIMGSKVEVSLTHYLIHQTAYNPKSVLNNYLVKILDYYRWERFVNQSKNYQDFFGFQYYHHNRIRLGKGRFLLAGVDNENKETSDMGWEIYPEGIFELLKKVSKYNTPIYITENGIADEKDSRRKKFIQDHLSQVYLAMKEKVDVRGYFYWSLLDNFEWADGFGPKFGLYSVQPKTFLRSPRKSAQYYKKICQTNEL